MQRLNYDILDAKVNSWHDDYNSFKRGLKDLEVMMRNTINTAFETISTVPAGLQLLENFVHLSSRETIKRTLEKKISELYQMFLSELNKVKREFDQGRSNPPIHPLQSRSAGAAMWARSLMSRIDLPWNSLEQAHSLFLADLTSESAADAAQQYHQLRSSLEEYAKKIYNEWFASLEENTLKRLDVPLIVRSHGGNGEFLESNFDAVLQRAFNEIFFWERINQDLPKSVVSLSEQEEKFRIARENVQLVVKDYNYLIKSLNPEEKRLFKDRVAFIDEIIKPGLIKLTWTSPEMDDYLVECRKNSVQLNNIVSNFKENVLRIQANCYQIAEVSLINIKKKKVYKQDEFETRQKSHQTKMREKIEKLHKEIQELMGEMYNIFKADSEEVKKEWTLFTEKTDKLIESSLRQGVRKSLQELSKSINGDGKIEVSPLFQISVVLEMNKVEMKPSLEELTQAVSRVAKDLIATNKGIPRLVQALGLVHEPEVDENANVVIPSARVPATPSSVRPTTATATSILLSTTVSLAVSEATQKLPKDTASQQAQAHRIISFYETISSDEEITKLVSGISAGMVLYLDHLQRYLTSWDKYKHLWHLDKDAYIRRYARSNLTLEVVEADITEKQETQKQIEAEETIKSVQFIRLDASMLKYSLISHCSAWQNKFTALLSQNAIAELHSLHDTYVENISQLKFVPTNLDTLREFISLHRRFSDDSATLDGRFDPLQKQFKALEKFEVQVDDSEKALMEKLPMIATAFRQSLIQAEETVKQKKEQFKNALLQSAEEFGKLASSLREEFQNNTPKVPTIANDKALTTIADLRKQLEDLAERETKLKQGLAIFNIDAPVYKELTSAAKDLDLIEQVWSLKNEWENSWESWKKIKFMEIKTQVMEDTAVGFQKKIVKLGRELKQLPVWQDLKDKVDNFKTCMPLIQDLKNPAFRPRHWEKLKVEIGKPIEHESDDFTLEVLLELGLDAKIISNLSISASKELAIEESLKKIEERWAVINLDIIPHRDDYFRLRSAEEIFKELEDNQVTLSTMKASKYFAAFDAQVEHWEQTLSHILETVEMILQVQRQWRYLETIFGGFEDIRK